MSTRRNALDKFNPTIGMFPNGRTNAIGRRGMNLQANLLLGKGTRGGHEGQVAGIFEADMAIGKRIPTQAVQCREATGDAL